MDTTVQLIDWPGIGWSFLPVALALALLAWWSLAAGTALYALARMLIQLLLVGMVLTWIFAAEHAGAVSLVLAVMIAAASWISMRPLSRRTPGHYRDALLAIAVGGGVTLAIVTQASLDLQPWHDARYVVPLAGMVFSSAMNSVSLAAERFESELAAGRDYGVARNAALHAALIPVLNSLFAVGLVSLPGMMTGQILSGVAPVIAAKYQIVVMCMVFGASTLSAAGFLALSRNRSSRSGPQPAKPPDV